MVFGSDAAESVPMRVLVGLEVERGRRLGGGGRGRAGAGGGPRVWRIGRTPAGLLLGDGAQALGEAAAALVGGDLHRLGTGGGEALAARAGEQLGHPELGLADRSGGGAVGAGEGQGGDEGALDVRGPAVGAVGLARDGLEIEQGAEGLERVFAGDAAGSAAIADDGNRALDHERKRNRRNPTLQAVSGGEGAWPPAAGGKRLAAGAETGAVARRSPPV